MGWQDFGRAWCWCGTREDRSDDGEQMQPIDHDPNSCPHVEHIEPTDQSTSLAQAQRLLRDKARRFEGGTKNRDPPLSDEVIYARGNQVIQWMEDPNANDPPCPVTVNTLTYEQMKQASTMMHRDVNHQSVRDLAKMRFPEGVEGPRNYIHHAVCLGRTDKYKLFFAQGVICLSDIFRVPGSSHPNTADVALTLYKKEFGNVDTLRHIFAFTILNAQTLDFIVKHLEARSMAEFGSADKLQSYTFLHGTPEYEGLLGTRIARTAAYLVLGAFPRGERRIARIEVYPSPSFSFEIRFDIEPIF